MHIDWIALGTLVTGFAGGAWVFVNAAKARSKKVSADLAHFIDEVNEKVQSGNPPSIDELKDWMSDLKKLVNDLMGK